MSSSPAWSCAVQTKVYFPSSNTFLRSFCRTPAQKLQRLQNDAALKVRLEAMLPDFEALGDFSGSFAKENTGKVASLWVNITAFLLSPLPPRGQDCFVSILVPILAGAMLLGLCRLFRGLSVWTIDGRRITSRFLEGFDKWQQISLAAVILTLICAAASLHLKRRRRLRGKVSRALPSPAPSPHHQENSAAHKFIARVRQQDASSTTRGDAASARL